MSNDKKKIIYGNGEHYIVPITKGGGGGDPDFFRSYDDARDLIVKDISTTKNVISNLSKDDYLDDAVVFCLRLNKSFIAKSYHPLRFLEEAPVHFIGSQKWQQSENTESKLLFVRMNNKNFSQLLNLFDRKKSQLTEGWMNDIRKIEAVSVLQANEKIVGFDGWKKGKVELVLHPLTTYSDAALSKTISKLKKFGVSQSDIKYAQYERGLTFISAEISRSDSQQLGAFNLLRSVHPLGNISFPEMRMSKTADAPRPSNSKTPSPIKVGVFDGGSDPLNPILLDHVKEYSLTKEPPDQEGVWHGTAVAGCVLYGPLNGYKSQAVLPAPSVSVESYRVFPTASADPELYEIIDQVEQVVAQRSDIKVYNLSFGPAGPIMDNHIRRFTYALDRLAYKHNVLFTVAVGNEGDGGAIAGRVQSPADGINVLGIGAYTYEKHSSGKLINVEASYSCHGPGREGCKVKPDISAFGGCKNFPIALTSLNHGYLSHARGTSFSSPIVAGSAAELMGRCAQLSPLLTRVLMINRANTNELEVQPHPQIGHGIILERPDHILECTDKRVTIMYNGTLTPKKYAKIPIPFVKNPGSGKVNIRWTIGVLTKPDIENVDEYSAVSIEDTFHPHSQKYKFAQPDPHNPKKFITTKTVNLLTEKTIADGLLAAGWKQPKFPITKSGSGYKDPEKTRRAFLKWDTIVDRTASCVANDTYEPFLTVHALSRNEYLDEFSEVSYGVVVTLEFPKYKGDLYAEIGKIFTQLSPLSVKSMNQVLLQT